MRDNGCLTKNNINRHKKGNTILHVKILLFFMYLKKSFSIKKINLCCIHFKIILNRILYYVYLKFVNKNRNYMNAILKHLYQAINSCKLFQGIIRLSKSIRKNCRGPKMQQIAVLIDWQGPSLAERIPRKENARNDEIIN